MFAHLLESDRTAKRTPGGVVASLVIHGALVAAGALGTARVAAPAPEPLAPVPTIYVPVVPAPAPAPAPRPVAAPTAGSGAAVPALVPRVAAFDIPTTIPSPDVPLTLPSPGAPPIAGGDGPVIGSIVGGGAPGGSHDGTAPYASAQVERVAHLTSRITPAYPDALQRMGIEGRVVVRLVVDTLGRVEPSGVTIVASSHDRFTAAVRDVLPSLRFAPARIGARRVRQLVEMPFEFRVKR